MLPKHLVKLDARNLTVKKTSHIDAPSEISDPESDDMNDDEESKSQLLTEHEDDQIPKSANIFSDQDIPSLKKNYVKYGRSNKDFKNINSQTTRNKSITAITTGTKNMQNQIQQKKRSHSTTKTIKPKQTTDGTDGRSKSSKPTGVTDVRSQSSKQTDATDGRSKNSKHTGVTDGRSKSSKPTGVTNVRSQSSKPTDAMDGRSNRSKPTGGMDGISQSSKPTGGTDGRSRSSKPTGVTDSRKNIRKLTGVTDGRSKNTKPTDVTDGRTKSSKPTGISDVRSKSSKPTDAMDGRSNRSKPLAGMDDRSKSNKPTGETDGRSKSNKPTAAMDARIKTNDVYNFHGNSMDSSDFDSKQKSKSMGHSKQNRNHSKVEMSKFVMNASRNPDSSDDDEIRSKKPAYQVQSLHYSSKFTKSKEVVRDKRLCKKQHGFLSDTSNTEECTTKKMDKYCDRTPTSKIRKHLYHNKDDRHPLLTENSHYFTKNINSDSLHIKTDYGDEESEENMINRLVSEYPQKVVSVLQRKQQISATDFESDCSTPSLHSQHRPKKTLKSYQNNDRSQHTSQNQPRGKKNSSENTNDKWPDKDLHIFLDTVEETPDKEMTAKKMRWVMFAKRLKDKEVEKTNDPCRLQVGCILLWLTVL